MYPGAVVDGVGRPLPHVHQLVLLLAVVPGLVGDHLKLEILPKIVLNMHLLMIFITQLRKSLRMTYFQIALGTPKQENRKMSSLKTYLK